jgi:hypothetical protein
LDLLSFLYSVVKVLLFKLNSAWKLFQAENAFFAALGILLQGQAFTKSLVTTSFVDRTGVHSALSNRRFQTDKNVTSSKRDAYKQAEWLAVQRKP